ncbi:MAG: hypothetical protein KME64_16120 [Scytonematopsis contorta HA4267-MV1]|jgi:hypothetical protein|nr:hypothetical protein [Scytonematopsis contorta HA4267-MV1]
MKWIFVLVILLSSAALYPFQIPAQKPLIVSTKVSQTKNTRTSTPRPKSPSNKLKRLNGPRAGLAGASLNAPKSSDNP